MTELVATPAAQQTKPPSWVDVAPLGVARTHLNAAASGGDIYAIGGLERGRVESSRAVERFDAATETWQRAADLPNGTDHAAVAAVGSQIFVFGGNFASPSQFAYRLDAASGQWTQRAQLPEPRAAGGAAAIGPRIYVVGGFGIDRRLLSTAYEYETATDRWERIPDLPTPREHLAAVAFRGTICAIGGHFGGAVKTALVECYDPSVRRWSTLPPLLTGSSDFDAVAVADQIWAVGDQIQVFDGDQWRVGPMLGTPRFGVAAAVLGRTIYVIGGSARVPSGSAGAVERLELP